MSNLSMEAFVSSIRNMFQSTAPDQSSSSINFVEIYNMLNSNIDIFTETPVNLVENVLPVFPLPEFTLPHLFVLYAIINKIQQHLKSNTSAATNSNQNAASNEMDSSASAPSSSNLANLIVLGMNADRLISLLESSIQLADEIQVSKYFFFVIEPFFKI
jgi:hypothetical protein